MPRLWLLIGAGAALIALVWGFTAYVVGPRVALQKAATHQAQAQTVQVQAQGQLNTTAAQVASKEVIHEQTIQTTLPVVERRIAQAPGSDDLVDPRSARAFFDGVCQYRAADPGCRAQDPGRSDVPPELPAGEPAAPQD